MDKAKSDGAKGLKLPSTGLRPDWIECDERVYVPREDLAEATCTFTLTSLWSHWTRTATRSTRASREPSSPTRTATRSCARTAAARCSTGMAAGSSSTRHTRPTSATARTAAQGSSHEGRWRAGRVRPMRSHVLRRAAQRATQVHGRRLHEVDGEEFRGPARWMDQGNVLRVRESLRRPLPELHGRARRRPEGVHGR